jgi:hypothetical protein
MENKNELVQTIKTWVNLDNQIRELNKKCSTLKKQKAAIGLSLVDCMRTNTIDCVKITGGELLYKKKTTKQPLGKKLMYDLLVNYFPKNSDDAEKLKAYFEENRIDRTTEKIVRKETAVLGIAPVNQSVVPVTI